MTNKPHHTNIVKSETYKLKPATKPGAPVTDIVGVTICPSESRKKYSFLQEETLSVRKLKKPHLLLPFKLYSKIRDRRRFKQQVNVDIFEKYKAIVNDLLNRIYIANPKNDVSAITDIDKEFFACINGRPLNLHTISYKSYKCLLTDLLRTRHAIGYTSDCILSAEVNYKNELQSYDLSVKRFTDQVSYLDMFINENYQKSMELLGQWEKLTNLIDLKSKELQNLGIEKFTIMSRIINLDSIYSIQQKYGRFLYYLSPPSWRMANRDFARSIEIEQKGFDFGKSNDDDTFDITFTKLYRICFGPGVKPALYFTKPNDLMNIFNSMEEQQLYYFTHINHLAPLITKLKNKINFLKDLAISDTSSLIRTIKSLKDLLKINEDKCSHLEQKFFHILHCLFYDSTAATDVLKLNFNLQFCFEKVFGEKATHMDIVSVSKCLEKNYMDYSKALDMIQSQTIRHCVNKFSEKEKQRFKRAKLATTELRLFHRLEQELMRTYDFPTNSMQTFKKQKSNQSKKQLLKTQFHKPSLKENKKISLTEAEIEYLMLFTEWTQNEDPAHYLQSLNINRNKE